MGAPAASTSAPSSSSATKQVKLDRENELRIEVSDDRLLRLRLLAGTAEIFGSEIPSKKWLTFHPQAKIAVFTWYGATIEMDDTAESDYIADKTPMITYVNVHVTLDARRNRAKASSSGDLDSSQGPRVIIVGPTDSGKSTLSKMLLSWAARLGSKPTYVDLDISQGSITIPGCIAATPIEMPIDPVEGFPLEMSLVYFYGHTTPSENVELYKLLVRELACILEKRFVRDAESRAAGMVINTMGWVEGIGYDYELLKHAIDSFNANVVLVLGQEKLFSQLRNDLSSKPNVDVVKLNRSGGVVFRNTRCRLGDGGQMIKEYFYGLVNDLFPHSNIANFSDVFIYRIGGVQAPTPALPLSESVADPTRLVPVNINGNLLHLVLAVSYAPEPEQIISSNVAGFIYITDIDIPRQRITFLAPSLGDLPSKILIMGTLTWQNTLRIRGQKSICC